MAIADLAELPRYPAIGGTCLIALGIFALGSPEQVDPLTLDIRAFWAEPWRLLTSALLHAAQLRSERWLEGLAHVGFNCYWLWRLGAAVEQRLGHLRTIGLIVLFAVGGSLLEYAFTGPCVGLSGVVYGFAAMLWVLDRRSARLVEARQTKMNWRGLIDRRTAQFFAFWFGFCVIATLTKVMPIANFAHAGGAMFGALIGVAMTPGERHRAGPIAAIVVSLGLVLTAASAARPWVNISDRAGLDAMALAERAVADDQLGQAIRWAERGVGYWRTPADHWAYLSWLYFSDGRYAQAYDALSEACRRDPDNQEYRALREQFAALAGE